MTPFPERVVIFWNNLRRSRMNRLLVNEMKRREGFRINAFQKIDQNQVSEIINHSFGFVNFAET